MNYKEFGTNVIVYDLNGKIKNIYNAIELAKIWFQSSNDGFYMMFGFNYVPSSRIYDIAKRQLGRI